MQDIIRPDASFTPRELFSRMQGAWFEPRLGSMWQENTDVTPTTTGGQTIGKLVDLSADRVASQATAANRPLFGARRNLLTYSQDFTNAAWDKLTCTVTPNSSISPWGTFTASTLDFSTAGANGLKRNSFTCLDEVYAVTHWVKSGTSTAISLYARNINNIVTLSEVNLATGVIISNSHNVIVTPDKNGFWRIVSLHRSNSGVLNVYSGSSSIGTLIYAAQQYELGSTATDYQRVTTATDYDAGRFPAIRHADSTDVLVAEMPDLGGGVFSSAGSVYFATAVGMSCLHNQSIGTSYNLPALQTDIYGTVITPARLTPPLEQRLAVYMHRLAGLSDADFFWQEQATDGMTGQLLTDDNDTILLRA